MSLPAKPRPKPPAQVEPYVEILGDDLTVEFLLTFGGAELYIPKNPLGRSRLEKLVGKQRMMELYDMAWLMQRRVPLANRWIAAYLNYKGVSSNEIARKLRVTDVTVRNYLKPGPSQSFQGGFNGA